MAKYGFWAVEEGAEIYDSLEDLLSDNDWFDINDEYSLVQLGEVVPIPLDQVLNGDWEEKFLCVHEDEGVIECSREILEEMRAEDETNFKQIKGAYAFTKSIQFWGRGDEAFICDLLDGAGLKVDDAGINCDPDID